MKTWKLLKEHPELWDRYFIREKIIKAIRRYLDDQQFHEVETPILIAHPPAESHLEVFETQLLDRNGQATPAYLSTSPEVPLKKLMVAGIGNCYAITKSFRNMETQGNLHNPEFTILEFYRVGADYMRIMEDTEQLIVSIARFVNRGSLIVSYQGKPIDLTPPWERLSVAQAFKKYAHVHFDEFLDEKKARAIAQKKGYTIEASTTWEQLYNQILLNEIEPRLGRGKPTILYDFPSSMAALSKKKTSDPRLAERFEFYIAGLELGDCYSELTDAKEQEERFKKELHEIQRLGKTSYDYDHDFINALKVGLPKCSGIAIGVDRLIMLFADARDIADTLFFPAGENG
ncbi:MAG: EF-P lysine aminoacylase EpmA [Candidatus Gottesmanbacteria bacterium]|nr:EF-P lysine aminoacylase EpmA [Candidatus Gottesmanbacteria bacterium]